MSDPKHDERVAEEAADYRQQAEARRELRERARREKERDESTADWRLL